MPLYVQGNVPIWSADAPPAIAGAIDSEFGNVTGNVPSGWTEFDFGNGLAVTEDAAGVRLGVTGNGGGWAGIYQAIPAGDFTVWTRVDLTGFAGIDFLSAALVLLQDATVSTGDLRVFSLSSAAAGVSVNVQSWTAYNAFASSEYAKATTPAILPTFIYLRVRRNGTTYTFDFSANGVGWQQAYTTLVLGITPAHFGLAVNTGDFIATFPVPRFPFFRYLSSDVGHAALMSGARIKAFRA